MSAFLSKPQHENTKEVASRSTRNQEVDGKITQGEIMAKTIVMIHGMFGGGWYWDNYKGFFEKRKFQCHTPTLRFHDVDPEDKPCSDLGTTSLLDYAQDLEDYIGELDERPILIGHSMGGLLAQILGARGLAMGLVLLTPAPPVE